MSKLSVEESKSLCSELKSMYERLWNLHRQLSKTLGEDDAAVVKLREAALPTRFAHDWLWFGFVEPVEEQ